MLHQNKHMKLLQLTIRRAKLKEEFEDKIQEMFQEPEEMFDENGKTASWYEDMGMAIPEELKQKNTSNVFPITDEFFEFYIKTAFLPLEEISYIAGDVEEGCEVILKSGDVIKAIENEIEVYVRIDALTKQTFLQKLKQLFK